MNFAEKLRELREENNITQRQLAEELYVTRQVVSKWETDRGMPDIRNLINISNFFKVSVDGLIKDEINIKYKYV